MPSEFEIPIASYRVPRPPDTGMRRVAMIAGGLGGGLLLLVGVWAVSGHHRSTAVPVIEADARPIRVKPDNPGGMQVADQNDDLLSGGADDQGGKLAPAPEAPAPQALRAQQEPPKPTAPAVAAAQPAPVPAPVAPPAAVKPAAVAPTLSGKAVVQLGSLESEELARTEWERLSKKLPDLLGSRKVSIVRADRDGKTFWRLRTGGFSDIAAATAFCAEVRAKGVGCNLTS